jgi:hypothetical protein
VQSISAQRDSSDIISSNYWTTSLGLCKGMGKDLKDRKKVGQISNETQLESDMPYPARRLRVQVTRPRNIFLEMETSCFFNIRNSKDSLDLSRNYIHDFGSYHFQIIYLPPATQSSTSISPISARSRYPSKSTAHEKDVHPTMAGHTDIFPKNLFWYHLLTALAYKPPGPIINKDLIGNIKGIT